MGRIVGLEIFDDEVMTTTEPADVEDVEEEPKKSGKKK